MLTRDELIDAIGAIDADLVEDFVRTDERLQKKKGRRVSPMMRFVALAACFALILASVPVMARLWREGPTPEPPKEVPVFENPLYTATELAELLEGDDLKYDAVATNAYVEVYVPSGDYLNICPISIDEYITLYERMSKDTEDLDYEAFSAFAEPILSKMEKVLNSNFGSCEIEKKEYSDGDEYRIRIDTDQYWISLMQDEEKYSVSISGTTSGRYEIVLNGQKVQIDQTQSDEEIMKGLSDVKEILFDMFGTSFTDVSVVRSYGSYSKHGAERVYVYFYNRSDSPMNDYYPRSADECIYLSFDNFENYSGDIVSDTVLTNVSIYYRKSRTQDAWSPSMQAGLISLEDAEALLYNGCVFGGHVCPLCMAMQTPVEFSGYDFVSFTYLTGYDKETYKTVAIPFYVFYKRIGTAKNGNVIYAKTNVCAIALSDYEGYLESQRKNHKQGAVETDLYP